MAAVFRTHTLSIISTELYWNRLEWYNVIPITNLAENNWISRWSESSPAGGTWWLTTRSLIQNDVNTRITARFLKISTALLNDWTETIQKNPCYVKKKGRINMPDLIVSLVPLDGLAPIGARRLQAKAVRRLLRSPIPVAILSIRYETWPPIGWHHPFVIGLSKYSHSSLSCGLTWPVGMTTVFQRPLTMPLHSPYYR